jgi:hypothetical protein
MYYGTVRLRGPYCTFLFAKRMVGLYVLALEKVQWGYTFNGIKTCSGAIRFFGRKG